MIANSNLRDDLDSADIVYNPESKHINATIPSLDLSSLKPGKSFDYRNYR